MEMSLFSVQQTIRGFQFVEFKLGLMALTFVVHILVKFWIRSRLLADIMQTTYSYGNVTFFWFSKPQGAFNLLNLQLGLIALTMCTHTYQIWTCKLIASSNLETQKGSKYLLGFQNSRDTYISSRLRTLKTHPIIHFQCPKKSRGAGGARDPNLRAYKRGKKENETPLDLKT